MKRLEVDHREVNPFFYSLNSNEATKGQRSTQTFTVQTNVMYKKYCVCCLFFHQQKYELIIFNSKKKMNKKKYCDVNYFSSRSINDIVCVGHINLDNIWYVYNKNILINLNKTIYLMEDPLY